MTKRSGNTRHVFESGRKQTIDRGKEVDDGGKKLASRYNRLKNACADPLTEVHLNFFSSALPLFTQFNLFLQRGDPLAHKVDLMTKSLLQKLCMRFINPGVLEGNEIDATMIDNEDNYLLLEETFLGYSTMNLLSELYENGDISERQKTLF